MRGRQHTEIFGKYARALNDDINVAMASIAPGLCGRAFQDKGAQKASLCSAAKVQQMIAAYQQGVKNKRTGTMLECNLNNMLIPAEMGGEITLSIINKDKGHINQVRAEIAERGI